MLLRIALVICCFMVSAKDFSSAETLAGVQSRTNVILIMTDDQGIGDFGCTGNPLIETPNIDAMSRRSFRMTNFYVSPVCTPTRACLMTGRYNYRTRAIDTYVGRAMMDSSEVTVAELLGQAGYATGIFGKWHLGDCYPMRAIDQGFQKAIVHRGGGIGQPSDPLAAEGQYHNPILMEDGVPKSFKGYCTDIYYDQALQFIQDAAQKDQPFFVYLPDNCPHGPFAQVPEKWYKKYQSKDLGNENFPQSEGHELPSGGKDNVDRRRRIYSMISNIDENVGRVYAMLDELKIRDNTVVIFLTDNGPNAMRYKMGFRGMKSSVYEGGIRTLFLIDWAATSKTSVQRQQIAAHIDVMPTILDLCGVPQPQDLMIDGRSLLPILLDESAPWPSRTLYLQSHRGNQPQRFHHFAARSNDWKLVHHSGFGKERFEGDPKFELFQMTDDPLEMNDVAEQHPDVVHQMKKAYESWFDDVSSTRPDNYEVPRIIIGTRHEPSTLLTRQDYRRTADVTRQGKTRPQWHLQNESTTKYQIDVICQKNFDGETITLHANNQTWQSRYDPVQRVARFEDISLPPDRFKLWASSEKFPNEPNVAYQVRISHNPL